MENLQIDPNDCSPQLLATFEKTRGPRKRLAVGDEFQIHIPGPWNGPVRVSKVSENGFVLKTLEGHLEAGKICFRLKKINEKETLFEIESLARSRDRWVDFFYDKLPLVRTAQTKMWTSFCQTFAEHACGNNLGAPKVRVRTERRNNSTEHWEEV